MVWKTLTFCFTSLYRSAHSTPGAAFHVGRNDFQPSTPLRLHMLQLHLHNFVQKSWAQTAGAGVAPPLLTGPSGFGKGHLLG